MKFLIIVILFHLTPEAAAGEAQTVIAQSYHPIAPDRSELIHVINCPTHRYRLTVNYVRNQIMFEVDESAKMNDLIINPLSSLLRSNELFGRLGFSCSGSGLNLMFLGFQVADTVAPRPVQYQALIGNDGKVLMNTRLQPTTLLFIQQKWQNNNPPRP